MNMTMRNSAIAALIAAALLLLFASTKANAWNIVCIHGPWSTYDLNLRMIRNITASDMTNFSYVESETAGRRLEPNPQGYSYWTFYDTPQVHGTQRQVHWATSVPWRVDMYGYMAMGYTYGIYDPNEYMQAYCPNSATPSGDWVIP